MEPALSNPADMNRSPKEYNLRCVNQRLDSPCCDMGGRPLSPTKTRTEGHAYLPEALSDVFFARTMYHASKLVRIPAQV
jgi:hypothetical protein